MDADESYREKKITRRDLYNNVTCRIEQILEATLLETTSVLPPTGYL